MVDPDYYPIEEAKDQLESIIKQLKTLKEKIRAGIRTVKTKGRNEESALPILDLLEEIHKKSGEMIEMVNIKIIGIDAFSESEPIFPYLT